MKEQLKLERVRSNNWWVGEGEKGIGTFYDYHLAKRFLNWYESGKLTPKQENKEISTILEMVKRCDNYYIIKETTSCKCCGEVNIKDVGVIYNYNLAKKFLKCS